MRIDDEHHEAMARLGHFISFDPKSELLAIATLNGILIVLPSKIETSQFLDWSTGKSGTDEIIKKGELQWQVR